MILAIHVSFAALTSLKYSGIQEKIKKLVSATAYPGRADNTRKIFCSWTFILYICTVHELISVEPYKSQFVFA